MPPNFHFNSPPLETNCIDKPILYIKELAHPTSNDWSLNLKNRILMLALISLKNKK